MIKRWMILCLGLVTVLVTGGCSVLPGEERAYPVCLGLHLAGDMWQASVRISTYTSPGDYMTVTASGATLAEAMTMLDASAPIRLHYGQVRMVIFSRELAASGQLTGTLDKLSKLGTFRADAMLCATEDDISAVLDELTPVTGTRLSKYLEVLLDSRVEQGIVPDTTLGKYRTLESRQSLLLLPVALADGAEGAGGMDAVPEQMADSGMKLQLGGAWLVGQDGRLNGRLTIAEHQLLRLMQGQLHKGALTEGNFALTLLEASARAKLDKNAVRLDISLRYKHSEHSRDGVKEQIISRVSRVLEKLAAANCDALGIGRQAIMQAADWAAWQAMDWPAQYPALTWLVSVEATPAL